ncbi:MAG: diguanylate cyclase [Chthonomonas sp.]|nr:diguanylate cyclase [Chthonomonas sp.]
MIGDHKRGACGTVKQSLSPFWLAIALNAVLFVSCFWSPFELTTTETVSTVIDILIGLAVIGGFLKAALRNRYAIPAPARWLLVAVGLFALGNIYFLAYQLKYGREPVISFADMAFLTYYIAVAWAVCTLPQVRTGGTQRIKLLLDSMLCILSLAMFSWFFSIQPILGIATGSWLEQTVLVAYPIGDLVLVSSLILLSIQTASGMVRAVRWPLVVGGIGFFVADYWFAQESLAPGYNRPLVANMGWTLAYVAYGIAAYRAVLFENRAEVTSKASKRLEVSPMHFWYAFVPAAVGWGVYTFMARYGTAEGRSALGITVCLLVLGIVRLIIAVREVKELNRGLHSALTQLSQNEDRMRVVNEELEGRNTELEMMQSSLEASVVELEIQRNQAQSNEQRARDANEELRGMQLEMVEQLRRLEIANEALENMREQIESTNEALAAANQMLLETSQRDGLTGLPNHRRLYEQLEDDLDESHSTGRPLSFLLLDVDHFKSYNDIFGHLAGDEALRMVASVLRDNVRATDVVARYGGEEFAVILRNSTLDGAIEAAERLRSVIEETKFPHRKVTMSIGVVEASQDIMHASTLIDLADQALYAAKHSGRNRVHVFGAPLDADERAA